MRRTAKRNRIGGRIEALLVRGWHSLKVGLGAADEGGVHIEAVGGPPLWGRAAIRAVPDVGPGPFELRMTGGAGDGVSRRLAAVELGQHVLILSPDDGPRRPDSGRSFRRHESVGADPVATLRTAALGSAILPGAVCAGLTQKLARTMAGDAASAPDLSPRERQIVTLTARGFSAREIGHQLFASRKTIETHRSRVMTKPGAEASIGVGALCATSGPPRSLVGMP